MKLLLLVNPHAGQKKGAEVAAQARQQLAASSTEVSMRSTTRAGEMPELAAVAVKEEWDAIVAVGGDGTVFEVLNGMMRGDATLPIPMGIIPVGTGNSFARDLAIKTPADGIAKILAGQYRKVDVGQFDIEQGTFYYLNLLGCGFVSDVAHKAASYKRWGNLSYVIGVFIITAGLKSYRLELEIDGQKLVRDNVFVEICNSTKTGGDMIMAPDAHIDDGYLDVIVLNKISRIGLLQAFPKIFKGTHVHLPQVEVFQAKQIKVHTEPVKILTPDGEFMGSTPMTVSILPQKITVFG